MKPLNKEALQSVIGLPVDRNISLIAFIGRLEEKNGPDILAAAAPQLMDENVQFIILVRIQSPEKKIDFSSLIRED